MVKGGADAKGSGRPERAAGTRPMVEPPPQHLPPIDGQEGWWKVETGANQSVDDIGEEFRKIFESAGSPPGAALSCDHVLLESTTLFFTPRAVSIARQWLDGYGGSPCEPPKEGILLIGNNVDQKLLPMPNLEVRGSRSSPRN
jgi:hypothetical protein